VSPIETVIRRVLLREGGVSDVGDGKGETRWGQTPGWLSAHKLPVPQSQEDAALNYAQWITQTGLFHAALVDDALTDALIDYAVHAGEARAIRSLQSAIGARPDGVIGPQTRLAIEHMDRSKAAQQVIADRLKHMGVLITADPEMYARFAKGWLARVAGQVTSLGGIRI